MDTTIKGFQLTEDNIKTIFNEICEVEIKDKINFKLKNISLIREDDDYGGYRVTFEANYNNELPVIMKIDVTTGDKITYKEIEYQFTLMLEDRKINVWSYNIETIIAEKFEAIIKRGFSTTRIRDYYDIYMLSKTQKHNINEKTLRDAILFTAKHRNTEDIIKEWKDVIEVIKDNKKLIGFWTKYQKDNFYARDINYEDLIESIKEIGNIYDA